eukprot:SM000014S00402  [mRNA]  locus=s14:1179881:1186731:- [translate_table: standard]
MGDVKDGDNYQEEQDLLDYEEEEEVAPDAAAGKAVAETAKKGYVGIHSSGFRDFLLKPELLRAIIDCGFEHPSEVQHECIPQAILGMDVICQAKSGMGKTAVFVLSTLQQIEPVAGQVAALVLCHTRELAYQICHEFERFSTYLTDVKVAVFYGGVNVKLHKDLLKNECPHIVVGTPGRILDLAKKGDLNLKSTRHFILDECDKMLESLDMRKDVQEIFKLTPHDKQVMMFSATLSKDIRPVCKRFMQDPMEIYVDDEAKLTLHGLVQHYIKLSESEKNRKLNDLLDALDFNQVVIFVKSVSRASQLDKLLVECNFPSICIHSGMGQEERLTRYKAFKEGQKRILVATDLVGRGIDIERVNIVINYDMPENADTYLHRVGRAGRFGTKGLAITFVASSEDSVILNTVQERFEVDIKELPEQIDTSTYSRPANDGGFDRKGGLLCIVGGFGRQGEGLYSRAYELASKDRDSQFAVLVFSLARRLKRRGSFYSASLTITLHPLAALVAAAAAAAAAAAEAAAVLEGARRRALWRWRARKEREEASRRARTDCVYYLASPASCKKGAECEFRHSDAARANPRDCVFWLSDCCARLDCPFRHPPLDGRLVPTALEADNARCFYFAQGFCFKGDRCPYLHAAEKHAAPSPAGGAAASTGSSKSGGAGAGGANAQQPSSPPQSASVTPKFKNVYRRPPGLAPPVAPGTARPAVIPASKLVGRLQTRSGIEETQGHSEGDDFDQEEFDVLVDDDAGEPGVRTHYAEVYGDGYFEDDDYGAYQLSQKRRRRSVRDRLGGYYMNGAGQLNGFTAGEYGEAGLEVVLDMGTHAVQARTAPGPGQPMSTRLRKRLGAGPEQGPGKKSEPSTQRVGSQMGQEHRNEHHNGGSSAGVGASDSKKRRKEQGQELGPFDGPKSLEEILADKTKSAQQPQPAVGGAKSSPGPETNAGARQPEAGVPAKRFGAAAAARARQLLGQTRLPAKEDAKMPALVASQGRGVSGAEERTTIAGELGSIPVSDATGHAVPEERGPSESKPATEGAGRPPPQADGSEDGPDIPLEDYELEETELAEDEEDVAGKLGSYFTSFVHRLCSYE